jgi:hypothetical protein
MYLVEAEVVVEVVEHALTAGQADQLSTPDTSAARFVWSGGGAGLFQIGLKRSFGGRRLPGDPVILQQPASHDHLLDLGGSFADQQHRSLPVQTLDLVLLEKP